MNRLTNLACILCVLINSACTNDREATKLFHTIDIEKSVNHTEVINLSQFASNITYLPLETNKEIYVPYIGDCKIYGDYIFVTHSRQCLLYDRHGKFIMQFGSEGRGPGEYRSVQNIVFDSQSNVYIQSLYDLLEFKIDGSFVKKYKNLFKLTDNYNEYIIPSTIISDTLVLGHTPNTTGQIESKALLISLNGKIVKSYKNYIVFEREKPVGISLGNIAHSFHNLIYYKEFYNDTLFYLDDQFNMFPEYIFNLGKYEEPTSERAKLPGQGGSTSDYLYIREVFQTDNYVLMNCSFGDHFSSKRLTPKKVKLPDGRDVLITINSDRTLGIFNKKTQNISFCKPTTTDNPLFATGISNDIDGGPRFFPMNQINDSTMLMWIRADQLIQHIQSQDFKNIVPKFPDKKNQLEELGKKLTPEDNEILMFVTFNK